MARRAFYSFYYDQDKWRVSKVRQMGAIEGNRLATDNEWEEIKKQEKVQSWIDDQQKGKSIVIVLIGRGTAGRKWINYEIRKGWDDNRTLVGIHIHNLTDDTSGVGKQSAKGRNPFEDFRVGGKTLSNVVKVHNPPQTTSKGVYDHISEKLPDWIEEAVEIRNGYPASSKLD